MKWLLAGGLLLAGVATLSKTNASARPLGLRNNNPGNLRPEPGDVYTWQGEIGVNEGYLVFDMIENGIRAAYINLRSYFKNGYNTVEKIIARWAPSEDDNDTEAYIQFVEESTGIPRDVELVFDDDVALPILEAIFYVESGEPVPRELIEQGALLAL